VTVDQLVMFLIDNFDLADYIRGGINLTKTKTTKRVQHMVQTFVIDGMSLDPAALTQMQLTMAFRERVEMRIPISAYF